jgi:heme oxygenase
MRQYKDRRSGVLDTIDGDLLQSLRRDTAALHRVLDRAPMMRRLLRADLTVEEYVRCLQHLYPAYAAIEHVIDPYLASLPGLRWPERRKTPALVRDLAVFGAKPALSPLSFAVRCPAEAWGALYVIEGATLGGQIISRKLARHEWFDGLEGREHFAGYQAACNTMWTGFRSHLLAAQDGCPVFAAAAIAGAQEAFVTIREAVTSV